MRKIFSLVCAVFMTVMMFGQSYGILVNGHTYFAGTPAGEYEGFTQYTAHVQINAGDYCQLYDASNGVAWAVKLNTYSEDGFTLNEDRYEVSVSGCYDFYIKLKYGADELYIGNGAECGEGEEISGGSEVDPNQMYVWNGISVTSAEDAIEKGGKAEAVQADGNNIVVGAAQKGNWCLKANKGFNSGAYYLGIAMDNAVNAGDTVKIAYFRTSTSNSYVLGMDFSADKASASTDHQILTEGDPQVLASAGVPAESTFIIPEGVENAKYMRIYRNSGSTGLWVAKVELVKAAGTSVDPGDDPGDEPGEGLKNPVLKVNVPADTKEVYVAGDFSEWAFLPMAAVEEVENQFTLAIEGEFESIAYKYACGNDWAYREVAEDGTDIADRSYSELDVVAKWLAVPGGDEPPTPGKEGYALLVNGTEFIDLVHGEEYEGYDQWFVEGAALKAGDVVKVHNYATEASWAIGILNPASSKHVANSEDGLVFDKEGEYTIYLKLKFEADEIYVAPLPDEGGDEPGEKIENPIFTVIVPEGTDSVFVAGSFDEWASFRKLSAVEGKDNQFTIQIEGEFEAIEYKYLAGPDWKYVEVREGDANRTFVVDALDEVSAWTSVPEGGEEPPTPGKEGYALLVNGTDLIDLTHGEEYEGYDQWFVEGAALKAGDVVKVHSYETEASWAIGILNPASSKHVANSEEGLVFDQDGEYTIYLKLKFEADEIYVAPLADEGGDEPVADGFYLIGTFNDWTPSAQYAFVLNPEAAPAVEYKVSVDLQEGDKLKGLAVIMGQWIYYPEGDDIVVPAEYAGNCTIYFRPEYNPDWAAFGGHIYIVKQSGQGIDEILSEGKAVKVLREGQVLIMKGNRTYTPMGQLVK